MDYIFHKWGGSRPILFFFARGVGGLWGAQNKFEQKSGGSRQFFFFHNFRPDYFFQIGG